MSRPLFLRKLRRYVAAIPALAFGFVASPALGTVVTINAAGITAGSSTANFTGATLTSTGGNFTKATSGGINPTQYIGVSGGAVANEVDRSQKITLGFADSGAVISEIVLGMIFLEGEAGDKKNEAVQLQTLGGGCNVGLAACILSASGTSAVWRGASVGIGNVLSPATGGNGGIFKITNPFGSDLINQLHFMPFLTSLSTTANNSDFGLVSITYTTTAIPEPGTLALVGLGMLGLALAGRRRARS
jgi:hypothetical protein